MNIEEDKLCISDPMPLLIYEHSTSTMLLGNV